MSDSFKNVYKNKTVLITGDSGFKGSWLAIWLVHLGAKVLGYSLAPKTKNDNFFVSGLRQRITHIEGDVRKGKTLLGVFRKYKPDFAFHLAAQAIVLDSYKNPSATFQTNVLGTVNFFEAVRKTPSVKVAINVTSDKCYENREARYAYREGDRLGGVDPYSASKAASEIVTHCYLQSFFNKTGSAHVASARAGNVMGGGDWADYRIFPDCMRALFHDRPIVVRNPNSVRPWQHVLEPLSGYLTLGAILYTKGKKYCGGWNFGPPPKNFLSVEQIVQETIEQWGKGKMVTPKNQKKEHEAGLLNLSISKAKKMLGWSPVLNYRETIKFAIEEYQIQNLSAAQVFSQRINHIQKYCQLRMARK